MTDRIFVYFVELPDGIDEAVLPCTEGYTIYIDLNLSQQKKDAAFRHALGHIENNDFERAELYGVQLIEAQAHEREVEYEKKTDSNDSSWPDDIDVRVCG